MYEYGCARLGRAIVVVHPASSMSLGYQHSALSKLPSGCTSLFLRAPNTRRTISSMADFSDTVMPTALARTDKYQRNGHRPTYPIVQNASASSKLVLRSSVALGLSVALSPQMSFSPPFYLAGRYRSAIVIDALPPVTCRHSVSFWIILTKPHDAALVWHRTSNSQ